MQLGPNALDASRDPAMEAGIAKHVWTVEEIVGLLVRVKARREARMRDTARKNAILVVLVLLVVTALWMFGLLRGPAVAY